MTLPGAGGLDTGKYLRDLYRVRRVVDVDGGLEEHGICQAQEPSRCEQGLWALRALGVGRANSSTYGNILGV